MKKFSLKFKLSISYALLALLLVASVSFISNIFFRGQFEQYMIREQETKNREVVSQVTQQMIHNTNTREREMALETVGVSALERGVIIKVYDTSGTTLWDATVHNGGFCRQMLQNMAAEMQSRSPSMKGYYKEVSFSLLSGVQKVGTVKIGYYGPFYYSANDADFIDTLNRVLFGVGMGALILAVLLGLTMAARISNPIAKVIGATKQIASGNYEDTVGNNSNTRELDSLIASINSLSARLRNQEALRKRLTTDIAHELRTPLAALQGNMEALIDGIWEPDKSRFESCHEEILRLSRLVSELERLSQLEDESSSMNLTQVNLRELADKAVKSFEAEILKKQIRLTTVGPPVEITADSDKISRVFINLLSNALKYTPDGGSIRIAVSKEKKNAVIKIADTGTGIAKEDIPYVFERFYRTDLSRSSQSGGAGIGLTIVKAIVQMHHGEITLESEPGKGTEFRIALPYQQPEQ
jgi:signal transduction histidine kinase